VQNLPLPTTRPDRPSDINPSLPTIQPPQIGHRPLVDQSSTTVAAPGAGSTFIFTEIAVSTVNAIASQDASRNITADLSNFDLAGLNIHRITAIVEGRTIGGTLRDGMFEVEGNITAANIQIAYVPHLIRTTLQLGSPIIRDLAGNGGDVIMDVAPVIIDDRMFLPVRFVAEDILGLPTVGWDDDSRMVTLFDGDNTLSFAIGEMAPGMDAPAQIVNDRTMVPIRFVSEFFGATVNFDYSTGVVEIIQ